MSSDSHPNSSSTRTTVFFAAASLPQINIVGLPPAKLGLTMRALPTELNAFTRRASGNSFCRRSIRESSSVVKNFSTPLVGGASPMGFVASMTVLPARLRAPADRSTSAAADPLTASTASSPNFAASSKLPMPAFGFWRAQSASLSGVRVAIMTSYPCFRNPPAKTLATSPEPRTPTFMICSSLGLR